MKKTAEQIHAEYNLLSSFIESESLFDQLDKVLADNIPSKFGEDLGKARDCIESLKETIQLVQGWIELEAKQLKTS